ncbi:VOC family protein [Actinoplanes aureus]|uniref:VOC family protein n=1 Tax=Actinoplanes aureus TaxID=2792083 RepID=A0A931C8V3_9ACTN|nr:VOC family protein [Actinoplanes aureus]MBG0563061.1 VOC family protein [Actinoplanes aureus]
MTPVLNAIGLAVADMATSLAFYRLLGMEFAEGAEQAPHVEVTLSGGVRLMWDTHALIKTFDSGFTPPGPDGARISLAFECAGPAEVDAVYRRLVEAGHAGVMEPWDAEWGQRYAVVHDPDGNGVDLYAPLAG